MLRKAAAVLAVSLVCLSGQAYAQQLAPKATTSAVKRVGAQAGEGNEVLPALLLPLLIIGTIATVTIIAVNDDESN